MILQLATTVKLGRTSLKSINHWSIELHTIVAANRNYSSNLQTYFVIHNLDL